MTREPPDLPDHDPAIVAALVAALGVDRLAALLAMLATEVAAIGVDDRRPLPATLHRLYGSSSSLGLPRLAAEIAAIRAVAVAGPVAPARLAGLAALHAAGAAAVLAAAGAPGDHGTAAKR